MYIYIYIYIYIIICGKHNILAYYDKPNISGIFFVKVDCFSIRGRPIIGADIKHFTDYRYRPFSKQICRIFFLIFFFMQTNIQFTGDYLLVNK